MCRSCKIGGMVEQFQSAHLVSWLIFRYVKKYTDLKANLILRLSWFCASLMVAVSSKKKKEKGSNDTKVANLKIIYVISERDLMAEGIGRALKSVKVTLVWWVISVQYKTGFIF